MPTKLEQIREGEAPAEIAGLYRDIRHCLRTTYVPLPFRVLAAHRGALKAVWQQLRPNVITRAFEESANDIRAALGKSAADLGVRLIEPVLASVGIDVDELDEAREQIDLFHYTDPKILLCLEAMHQLGDRMPIGGHHLRAPLLQELPLEADHDIPQLMLAPEEPGGVVGEIFHDIMHAIGLPLATEDLRALGHWPEMLDVAWEQVGPMFQRRELAETLKRLHEQCANLLHLFPHRLDPSKGLLGEQPDSIAAVERVVDVLGEPSFRLALFVSGLKVGFDGPQDALDSPYTLDFEEPPVDQLELS